MMNRRRSSSRSRSRARESETRQPMDEGRRSSAAAAAAGNNPPRTPRSTGPGMNAPTPPPTAPSTPHSAPPGGAISSAFPKARCYRLNLEKPFDIRDCKSPLGRDYSGPPISDSDLPPAQGPVEYYPPPHLCSREEMAGWRRHSWGGANNNSSTMSGANSNTPSEMMANLHVSASEESSNEAADPTAIAISTARIFRGIVVDRSGVITSMNSRAMRSQRGKTGENKNKMGEKSRQAAKIDKAKDLIDEVVENGGAAMSDEENDPSKIVSLFVMGEYEELDDLVRDGSKKLRDSKSLSDEAIYTYNRPRQGGMQPMMAISPNSGGVLSQNTNANVQPHSPSSTHYSSNVDPTSMSPKSTTSSNLRKRVFGSADKSRSRYKQVPRSAPPKLKANPRDSTSSRSSGRAPGSSPQSTSQGYHRGSSNVSYQAQQQTTGMLNGCINPNNPAEQSKAQQQSSSQPHHYFPQQCNFFPGNTDWTESMGFSINSLWNCGANGGHMSPTMTPPSASSPRGSAHGSSQQGYGGSSHNSGYGGHTSPTTGGGMYHGSGAPAGGYGHNHHHSSGYHGNNYHHQQQSPGYNSNGYYNNVEGRNPSQGYGNGGYRSSSAGVRDQTVVM